MDEQGPGHEAVRRLQVVLLFAQRLPERAEELDELAVVRTQFIDVPAFANLHAQGLGGQHVLGAGLEDDAVFQGVQFLQGGGQVHPVATRIGQHGGRNRTKTLPLQLLAHLFALVLGQLREHHQGPGAVPGRHIGAVDPLEGLLEPPPAGAGQAVVTASADLLRTQPAFLGQAEDGGADQPLVDAHGLQQLDQAAQPDGAAMGLDGIAIEGDDQRAGTDRRLLLEAGDELVQGHERSHGHKESEKDAEYTRRLLGMTIGERTRCAKTALITTNCPSDAGHGRRCAAGQPRPRRAVRTPPGWPGSAGPVAGIRGCRPVSRPLPRR
ncbi:hypothetical protein D9M68_523920 [compost metagenome]